MHGIVLTQTDDLTALLASISTNDLALKIVTGWGWPWDDASRSQVVDSAPQLLVRTVAGDGTRGQPILDTDTVLGELAPWYDAGARDFEIGNEPNAYDDSDDAAWDFRYWFLKILQALRMTWPDARIVSPGLIDRNQEPWWTICMDAFGLADQVGFHAYTGLPSGDTGQLDRALDQLGRIYPDHAWQLTEAGINDPAVPPETKASYYAEFERQLAVSVPQVAAVYWYHFCDQPADEDQRRYALGLADMQHLAGGDL